MLFKCKFFFSPKKVQFTFWERERKKKEMLTCRFITEENSISPCTKTGLFYPYDSYLKDEKADLYDSLSHKLDEVSGEREKKTFQESKICS